MRLLNSGESFLLEASDHLVRGATHLSVLSFSAAPAQTQTTPGGKEATLADSADLEKPDDERSNEEAISDGHRYQEADPEEQSDGERSMEEAIDDELSHDEPHPESKTETSDCPVDDAEKYGAGRRHPDEDATFHDLYA